MKNLLLADLTATDGNIQTNRIASGVTSLSDIKFFKVLLILCY
jgi:hypothetical protein